MKKCNCVHRYLCLSFRTLGRNIAKHPLLFCLIPLLCTSVFSLGFFRIKITKDLEYLLPPINGRARKEMDAVESLFPQSKDENSFLRETRFKPLFAVIFVAKHHSTVLREDIVNYLETVDYAIKNITISWKNETIRYQDVCQITTTGGCYVNEIFSLKGKIKQIEKRRLRIRYPVDNRITSSYRSSVVNMGGVTIDENGYIENAKAFRLIYYLKYSTPKMDEIIELWTEEFKQVLSYLHSDYVNVFYYSKNVFDDEVSQITGKASTLLFIVGPLMITFAMLTCLTNDWVTSKPWVAIAGCFSPAIGTAGAFGLLLLCGAEYVDMNISLLFLLTGVGLDDSFILLAAWRSTDPNKSVEDRMGETYSKSAVSVTITSLTNVLCFCIGLTTPYNIIRIFSMYGTLSLFFCYIYQLTFFGSILALTGFLEKSDRHSLFCIQIKPDNFKECSIIRLLYYGWPVRKYTNLSFYREKLAIALTKPLIKIINVVIFVLYLAGGIYSLRHFDLNYKVVDLFPYNSQTRNAVVEYYEHFTHYPHAISIVINGTLDYSQPQVQREVQSIISTFASAPNMAGNELVISWLKVYLDTVNDARFLLSYAGYNMTDPEDFIYALQNIFLRMAPFRRFKGDIVFNQNKTKIIASRYIVGSKNILNSKMERKLLLMLWDIADSCQYQIYVHNAWFIFYDHLTDVINCSIQSFCTAVIAILLVFIIFVPNIITALCIALTIVSVQTGVIGYMSLWSVNFDVIAMTILIMSAGLSVDYVSHVSYAYISSKCTNPDEKLKYALHAVGYPVIQGCLSTLLSIMLITFVPLYALVIFFKIITLVVIFSGAHALFFLPVALSIWDMLWSKMKNIHVLKLMNNNTKDNQRNAVG